MRLYAWHRGSQLRHSIAEISQTMEVELSEVRERMARLGMDARGMPAAEFSAYVKSEIAKWAKVVKASGAKPG